MTIKIAITGRLRSGKDTVVDMIEEKLEGKTVRLAFGDKVKEFAHKLYPNVPRVPKPRKLYQFMNILRDFDEDIWVNQLGITLKQIEDKADNIIITDLRQTNEEDFCRKNDFFIIKVESPTELRKKRVLLAGEEWNEEFENHPSEATVDLLKGDIVITNDGTLEDLEQAVDSLLEKLGDK